MPKIFLENHQNHTTFGYSLIRLCGQASMSHTSLTIEQEPSNKKSTWLVRQGHFKAFILLQEGKNKVKLSSNAGHSVEYTFFYDPKLINTTDSNPAIPVLRPVYFYTKDHDGSFNVPSVDEPHDLQTDLKKQQVATLLMQTFCAESVGADRTFSLEVEQGSRNNLPRVYAVQSKRWTREEFRKLGNEWKDGGHEGYQEILKELCEIMPNDSLTFYCILGGSIYYPSRNWSEMATALGGGKLGLFTDGTFSTWASSVDEIFKCWMDERKIDTTKVRDDGGGRSFRWGNYATGVGACMHEIGHCFGCPHTSTGIMSRGFDHFNRFFMLNQPGDSTVITQVEENGACWEESSIDIILKHNLFKYKNCIKLPENKQKVETLTFHKVPESMDGIDINSMMDVHYFVFGSDHIGGGIFENVLGDEWVERHGKKVMFRFREISRTRGQIIITDAQGRNLDIKLSFSEASVKQSTETSWRLLSSGKVLFANRPQDMDIIKAHDCRVVK